MSDQYIWTVSQMRALGEQYADQYGLEGAERNAFAHVFSSGILAYQNSPTSGLADVGAQVGWSISVGVEVVDSFKYFYSSKQDPSDLYQRMDIFRDLYNGAAGTEIGRIVALNPTLGSAHDQIAMYAADAVRGTNPIAIVDKLNDPRVPSDLSTLLPPPVLGPVYNYFLQSGGPDVARIRDMFWPGTDFGNGQIASMSDRFAGYPQLSGASENPFGGIPIAQSLTNPVSQSGILAPSALEYFGLNPSASPTFGTFSPGFATDVPGTFVSYPESGVPGISLSYGPS